MLRQRVIDEALAGTLPTSSFVRQWHQDSLHGVQLAERWVAGNYRGQGPAGSQLSRYVNQVDGVEGAPASRVTKLVNDTFSELTRQAALLDARRAAGQDLAQLYADLLPLCAWIHGQWVRIHPFADHNGSVARLLALSVGLRYGLPLPLPGKPRNSAPIAAAGLTVNYNLAASNQMLGDDRAMISYLHLALASP